MELNVEYSCVGKGKFSVFAKLALLAGVETSKPISALESSRLLSFASAPTNQVARAIMPNCPNWSFTIFPASNTKGPKLEPSWSVGTRSSLEVFFSLMCFFFFLFMCVCMYVCICVCMYACGCVGSQLQHAGSSLQHVGFSLVVAQGLQRARAQ